MDVQIKYFKYVTSRSQDNFLYFKKKEFGIGRVPEQHKLVGQPLSNVGQALVNRCPTNLCCSGM